MLKSAFFLTFCAALASAAPAPHYGYRVIHTYPHDPQAFTQGLEYRNGFLYEGTGLNGRSTVRKVDLETGKVLETTSIDQRYFGEGITVIDGHIVELTWQTNVGFLYTQADFKTLKSFYYPGEGWGLANDSTHIYMSDGTAEIRVWDPKTLEEKRRITVHDGAKTIDQLNELEFVKGEIYANIWQTDKIVRISPTTGAVLGWIDMSGLLGPMYRNGTEDVLNGIAYDAATKRLWVTGKLWPNLFEIKIVPKK